MSGASFSFRVALSTAHLTLIFLPTEILTEIILILQQSWRPRRIAVRTANEWGKRKRDRKPSIRYESGWLSLVHINRRLRKIILDSPLLWSELDCLDIHPDTIDTILARSRRVPLTLNFFCHPFEGLSVKCITRWLVWHIASRTRHLRIWDIPRAALKSFISRIRRLEMPLLEELTLRSGGRTFGFLHTDLFASVLPTRLASLYLRNHILEWDSPLLSEFITDLSIGFSNHITRYDHILPSLPVFMAVIRLMPMLRSLRLENMFFKQSNDVRAKMLLPHCFKFMSLYTSNNDVKGYFELLKYLSFPPTAMVSVTIPRSRRHTDLPMDPSQLSDIVKVNSQTGHLYFTDNYTLSYLTDNLGCTSRRIDEFGGRLSDDIDSLTFDVGYSTDIPQGVPLALIDSCTFSSAVIGRRVPMEQWAVPFLSAGAYNVKLIRATLPFTRSFPLLEALRKTKGLDFLLFPELEVIILHDGRSAGQPDCTEGDHQPPLEFALMMLALTRKWHGAPLREFQIQESLLTLLELRQLESMPVDVIKISTFP